MAILIRNMCWDFDINSFGVEATGHTESYFHIISFS